MIFIKNRWLAYFIGLVFIMEYLICKNINNNILFFIFSPTSKTWHGLNKPTTIEYFENQSSKITALFYFFLLLYILNIRSNTRNLGSNSTLHRDGRSRTINDHNGSNWAFIYSIIVELCNTEQLRLLFFRLEIILLF